MPAGPVGTCWAADTWPDTAWEEGAWGAAGDPVVDPPAPDRITLTAADTSRVTLIAVDAGRIELTARRPTP